MKKELVKEIVIDNEEDLKKIKKYLNAVKKKFNSKYFDEVRRNQNSLRRFTPILTYDAYNVLDVDPVGIAMRKIKENSIAMMEIKYDENMVGRIIARSDRDKVKLYIEYTSKKLIEPLLTIF